MLSKKYLKILILISFICIAALAIPLLYNTSCTTSEPSTEARLFEALSNPEGEAVNQGLVCDMDDGDECEIDDDCEVTENCVDCACLPCAEEGETCSDDLDCCSDFCDGDTCGAATIECADTGEECEITDDCCEDHSCQDLTCCLVLDAACTDPGDCCSGNCTDNFCENL